MDVQYPSIDEPFEMGDDEDMGNSGLMFSYNTETQQINGCEVSEEAEYNTHLLEEVLKSVDDRDANIIKMCYGIGYSQPISISEISERTQLTPERVRQIRASVIKKLKSEYSKKDIGLI
jgi:RNA polymerase sigma factor (sigma-70 family)